MLTSILSLLAQAAPAAPAPTPAPTPLFQVTNVFWLTIGLILVITFVSAMIRRLTKDKCLKLFDDYHVTLLSEKRSTLWGDLYVSSQGIELLFDDPYTTRRGLVKTSALIYEDEYAPVIALTRTVCGLTDDERKVRVRQVRRTFNPNVVRRLNRMVRNLLNTLRDGITRSISLFIGTVTRTGMAGAVISQQANDINSLSGTFVSLAANAYEPLLERYIGKKVIIEIANPAGATPPTFELPGYLVDYTPKFIAVFNVSHDPVGDETVTLDPAEPVPPEVAGLTLALDGGNLKIAVTGEDAFILMRSQAGDKVTDFALTLLPGATLSLPAPAVATSYAFARTRQLDLIVPRTRARIRYGGQPARALRMNWSGMAPDLELTQLGGSAARLFTRLTSDVDDKPGR